MINEVKTYEQKMINKYKTTSTSLRIESDPELRDFRFVDELPITELIIYECKNVSFNRTPLKITKLSIYSSELKNINGIEKMKQLSYLNF